MTDNDQKSDQSTSWLQQQWQRVRNLARRDVVIAQVGAGSENVAVGKNIFQLNVAGHNITPYVLIIMAATLAVVAYLFYPYVEPIWNPWQMTGNFNIAVAGFGVLDRDGKMHSSAFGDTLSTSVFSQINDEYKAIKASGAFEGNVQVWHDSLGRDQGKNVHFGVIEGATPEERSKNAAKLADRIGAEMVIYGYLQPEEDAESLTLEFYYAAPVRAGDPDATTGAHELGTPIRSEVSAASNESTAKRQLSGPLAQRAAALFWLTQGLSYDLANDPNTALKILQEAKEKLTNWKDGDGKEVLYLFLARAAMWARQYDIAISAAEEAISINPKYANAYGVLGTVLMDRAQLFYIRGRTLTPEEQVCISTENIDNAAQTVEEARADNERAISVLQEGLRAAPEAYWPPVEHYLRLILGLAYRLKAQDDIFAGNYAAAEPSLERAKSEFEDALGYFTQDNYPALYASTVAGLAATNRYWAHLRIVDAGASQDPAVASGDRKEAAAFLQQTIDGYQACLDQQQRTRGNPVFQKRVLKCSCVPYQAEARNTLASLGGQP